VCSATAPTARSASSRGWSKQPTSRVGRDAVYNDGSLIRPPGLTSRKNTGVPRPLNPTPRHLARLLPPAFSAGAAKLHVAAGSLAG